MPVVAASFTAAATAYFNTVFDAGQPGGVFAAYNLDNFSLGNALVAIDNTEGGSFGLSDSLILLEGVHQAGQLLASNFTA